MDKQISFHNPNLMNWILLIISDWKKHDNSCQETDWGCGGGDGGGKEDRGDRDDGGDGDGGVTGVTVMVRWQRKTVKEKKLVKENKCDHRGTSEQTNKQQTRKKRATQPMNARRLG